MGEEPDHSKIYVEAIMEVNKNKKKRLLFLGIMVWGPPMNNTTPIYLRTGSPLEKSALHKMK